MVGWVIVQGAAMGATLGEALNATNLTWTTSGTLGASGWSVESSTTRWGICRDEREHSWTTNIHAPNDDNRTGNVDFLVA